MESYETVIIGGGMAALACASRLHEADRKFLVISDRLGGSIITSEDGQVNYGAYYVAEDYHHVNQFVTRGRNISQTQITFHTRQSSYTSFGRKVFSHYEQFARYKEFLHKIRPDVIAFRKTAETVDQAEALRQYPALYELYNMPATKFIDQNDFREFVDSFIGQIIFATAFVHADELEAFDLLWLSFPMILNTYEFTFHVEAITAPFAKSVMTDLVISIQPNADSTYTITTKTGQTIQAKNVVVATQTEVAQQLLQLSTVNPGVSVHMLHVRGTLQPSWSKRRYNFFYNESPIRTIARQADGTYLVYAHDASPALDEFFTEHAIIAKKYWDPAFHIVGNALLKNVQGPNLYLAGGHNICCLEDAFITGLFAAHKIINT